MRILFTFIVFLITIFLSACILPGQKPVPSALQVTSIPKATVYLDNKELGRTPYYDEKIPAGEHTIRLSADSANFISWQQQVKFTPRILTVINRILGPTDVLSSGEIVTMEQLDDAKAAELAVVSSPDGAKVVIDNSDVGLTPFAQKNTGIGEHEITVSFPNYTQRQIKVKTQLGYRLIISVQLAQILIQETTPQATDSATILGQNTVTTTPASGSTPDRPRVKILDTDTGWLRVRSTPSISASEVTKVYPGEFYSYLDQQAGWVKIKLDKDKEGWVSGQYVEKQL